MRASSFVPFSGSTARANFRERGSGSRPFAGSSGATAVACGRRAYRGAERASSSPSPLLQREAGNDPQSILSALGRLQPLPIVRKTSVNLVIQDNLDLGSKNCKKTHQENLHQV